MFMNYLCSRLKERALTCSKRVIPAAALLTLATSVSFCLPAKAIDPARLHMKPFGHSAEVNRVLGPLRPKTTYTQPERSVLRILVPEKLSATHWTALGPSPIPNGQTYGPKEVPVSGRVSAIAVDPKDPNIVYVGGAQGGVYRSRNGGKTWEMTGDEDAPTLSPSIDCQKCGWHGFIQQGKLVG